jgi:predicted nucleotidyltransferase
MGQAPDVAPVRAFRRKAERDLTVAKVILFGSRSRGSERPDSDWDVLIVSPNFRGVRFHERIRRLYKYWDYHRYHAFEPLPYTPEEFARRSQGPNIVREAVRTGIEVE